MTLNVVTLPPCEEWPEVSSLLDKAKEEQLTGVAVLGFDHEGYAYFDYARLSSKDLLWLSEVLRKRATAIID